MGRKIFSDTYYKYLMVYKKNDIVKINKYLKFYENNFQPGGVQISHHISYEKLSQNNVRTKDI